MIHTFHSSWINQSQKGTTQGGVMDKKESQDVRIDYLSGGV